MPAPCEATSDGDLAGNIRYQEEQWWLGSAQNRGQNPNRCEFDLNPVQGWGDERNGPAVRRDAEIAETVRTTYETGRNLKFKAVYLSPVLVSAVPSSFKPGMSCHPRSTYASMSYFGLRHCSSFSLSFFRY